MEVKETKRTTTTIDRRVYEVVDAEPMARKYGVKARFKPTKMVVEFSNGEFSNVHLSGPRILKNGLGQDTGDTHYGYNLDDLPAWVRQYLVF